jgi:hypothetical protein
LPGAEAASAERWLLARAAISSGLTFLFAPVAGLIRDALWPHQPAMCAAARLQFNGGKMVTVRIREIKSGAGFGGSTPYGTVTATVIIRSDELGRFEIGVQVPDQRDENLNAQAARAVLQRFSQEFSEALSQPLAFD